MCLGGAGGEGVKFKVRGVKKKRKALSGREPAFSQDLRRIPPLSVGPRRFGGEGGGGAQMGNTSRAKGDGVTYCPVEREEHGPRPRRDTKLNRSGDECDPDLHAMPRQCCFN